MMYPCIFDNTDSLLLHLTDPDGEGEGAGAVPINENLFIDDDEDLDDLDEAVDDLDLEQWPWWQAKSGLGCASFVACVLVKNCASKYWV